MNNIEKLQKLMQQSDIADCALITSDINRRYFTGMKSSAGTLLVMKNAAYLIIDFRYIEKARAVARGCEVILQKELHEQINAIFEAENVHTCAVESDCITIAQFVSLKEKLGCTLISDGRLSKAINSLRAIKTPEEISKIKQAQKIAEAGFEHILNFIKVGRSEKEIQLELDYFMLKNGAEALSFDTIALTGSSTSMPHGVPSERKVQSGDFVLLDFGAAYDGYHSDMTRTVAVGQISDKMREVYDIVLSAQKNALAKIRAGMTGSACDSLARTLIGLKGYGENFGHSLGHGVGLEIHEAPTASHKSTDILESGMVITVEPGIYIAGEFGVRIEDFVVVGENGCENLTNAPKELIVL